MERDEHWATTDDGWRLHLEVSRGAALDRARRPLLIVPGYGMNGFIFGFHPRGTSLVDHLADAGLEVWVANLRGQGPSRPIGPESPGPSLRAFAELDLPAVIDAALAHTKTDADRVDLLGASLGGSIAYAHLALEPDARVGSLVAIGSPLRWAAVNPVVRAAFGSSRIASLIRVKNTRRVAEVVLPLATRLPFALAPYLNHRHVDLSHARSMVQTVEDPHPRVNADIAKWIRAGDMRLRGVNVAEALRGRASPLFLVLGNRDGIVPRASALSVTEVWGAEVPTLTVGDDRAWYAHADLFVGDRAPEHVFAPIVAWLAAQA